MLLSHEFYLGKGTYTTSSNKNKKSKTKKTDEIVKISGENQQVQKKIREENKR